MSGWIKGMPRYWVDERVGCIAVRDSENTDHEHPGLDSDLPGVVWFRMGVLVKEEPCEKCGRGGGSHLKVSDELRSMAQTEVDRLNRINKNESSS